MASEQTSSPRHQPADSQPRLPEIHPSSPVEMNTLTAALNNVDGGDNTTSGGAGAGGDAAPERDPISEYSTPLVERPVPTLSAAPAPPSRPGQSDTGNGATESGPAQQQQQGQGVSTASPPAPEAAAAPVTTGQASNSASSPPPSSAAAAAPDPIQPSGGSDSPPAPARKGSLQRAESSAIGPSTDQPAAKPDPSAGPAVVITLLLASGARHPYKIDEKYLRRRNVKVEPMDPFMISVYTLKELIWRDWREEWEPRPSSPSSIRLIFFGRMLDDKQPLRDCKFSAENSNVVHMAIKPQEIVDEEDAKTSKGGFRGDRDSSDRTPGCRCIIL
ncbi:ubiquitin-related domain-containing protein [Lineolata rhizophorae]|uniref:Ubiquitin-related domain-containing protein n=1 Tax=Lineolata rhizophorae TaxID=578093 RepID=A0A6A6PAE5_9PEZI|nr:ubiquitin-related domain-containing protein [Lineolata rhizophorae]